MKVFVTMKSLAKRKNYLTSKEINLLGNPETLRELLTELVTIEVQRINANEPGEPIVGFLTNEEVELQAVNGKVGFSAVYDERKVNLQIAIQTCIQAFEDGLFKVFHVQKELLDLDETLHLQNGDQLTFIKLTMLAGRMW
ncbi:hypothetical protein RCG23_02375 [Neobacillus sp. PS3-34]|uniref:hypothetical protein n=1 Tax=Neobacillus sp. PS3-34 TaxID=3070678 RepID=UPI0027E11CF5|nr:hypothetical protein [Neobacillus sp. PS3-34]WML48980.1 hypothetical protein RCG23_02375 [Neobacillus sp. PS3-34]